MTYQLIVMTINIGLISWYFYNKKKDLKNDHHKFLRELKYQRHLRNAFDYQAQMYEHLAAMDAEMFKLAAEMAGEELNKCEQILKER